MHEWMGDCVARGINPSRMTYAELKYYSGWHKELVRAEMRAVQQARGG